ncbi:uncharacterized protein LY79DRAFT_140024 [Colletotrichum navitas]|uniref:Uncharacterized protein n=1 Tax=Colletotrichum navitas TaxID=681940 RepID=A0AAD8QBB0_9PEZI|nr:uncharacterized protein LY79DRAFT_140024 [Colletotrichum navitas]KAK1599407.1 hypothetical protein LY79DRAFT_140024 [Colletotrichum navitas]
MLSGANETVTKAKKEIPRCNSCGVADQNRYSVSRNLVSVAKRPWLGMQSIKSGRLPKPRGKSQHALDTATVSEAAAKRTMTRKIRCAPGKARLASPRAGPGSSHEVGGTGDVSTVGRDKPAVSRDMSRATPRQRHANATPQSQLVGRYGT